MRLPPPTTCLLVAACASLLAGPVGCRDSGIQGPQIGNVPRGFRFDPNARATRRVLDRRSPVGQRGYFRQGSGDKHSMIMITEYRGAMSPAEIRGAYEDARALYPSQRYGPVETLRVASLPAWAWLITQPSEGTIASLCYAAVIPDAKTDRTYTVEFYTTEPEFQNVQLLKGTVMSFAPSGSPAWKAKLGL
jgi:hypothetical protein